MLLREVFALAAFCRRTNRTSFEREFPTAPLIQFRLPNLSHAGVFGSVRHARGLAGDVPGEGEHFHPRELKQG